MSNLFASLSRLVSLAGEASMGIKTFRPSSLGSEGFRLDSQNTTIGQHVSWTKTKIKTNPDVFRS